MPAEGARAKSKRYQPADKRPESQSFGRLIWLAVQQPYRSGRRAAEDYAGYHRPIALDHGSGYALASGQMS